MFQQHSREPELLPSWRNLLQIHQSHLSYAIISLLSYWSPSPCYFQSTVKILISLVSKQPIPQRLLFWLWFAFCLEGQSFQITWRCPTSAPCRPSTGVLLGSLLFPVFPVNSISWFSYHCFSYNTKLILSFPPSNPHVSSWITEHPTGIPSLMAAHQLKLNPNKPELLITPRSGESYLPNALCLF